MVRAEPRFTPSSFNCTLATATLSLAEIEIEVVPETVEPDVGLVMETVGGVVSGGGGDPVDALKPAISVSQIPEFVVQAVE